MVLAHVPHNRRNIVHALMVGDNDQGLICVNIIRIGKGESGTQNIQGTHQKKLKPIDADFMGLITKEIKAYPLNGMEYHKRDSKTNKI